MSAATKPAVAWSHSALDMFENCPRKYWAVKVAKCVGDDNKFNRQGDVEHKALERSLKSGKPIGVVLVPSSDPTAAATPIDMSNMNPVLDKIRAAPGEKYYELEMTLDNTFVPCGWKDWNRAWVRGAADLLRVNATIATYIDWKSGKFRRSDDQIETTALLVFRHFPQVTEMRGALYYYRHNKMHRKTVHASEQGALWMDRIRRVKSLEKSKATDNWPATPNGLCAYCSYAACPSNTNPEIRK